MTPRPRNLWPPELTAMLRERDDRERDERCGAEPCECEQTEGVAAEEMEELGC